MPLLRKKSLYNRKKLVPYWRPQKNICVTNRDDFPFKFEQKVISFLLFFYSFSFIIKIVLFGKIPFFEAFFIPYKFSILFPCYDIFFFSSENRIFAIPSCKFTLSSTMCFANFFYWRHFFYNHQHIFLFHYLQIVTFNNYLKL